MFILVFIVAFGTKKSTLATYTPVWSTLFSGSLLLIFNSKAYTKSNLRRVWRSNLYRFQHTALTSRVTVYVLTVFWTFFFFFGESLLLLTFNYNTLSDLIPSGFFVFIKSHVIFMTHTSNNYLGDSIFFLILFFSLTAAFFLFNLRYTCTYLYTKTTTLFDLLVITMLLYLSINLPQVDINEVLIRAHEFILLFMLS